MDKGYQEAIDHPLDTKTFVHADLADSGIDEEYDDAAGQLGPNQKVQAKMFYAVKSTERSVSERIEDLFEALSSRRYILLEVLRYLDVPKRSDALQQKVNELQEFNSSVYTGYDYSLLLDEAGAIKKVNEDGTKFDSDFEQQPDIVEIEGAKFYRPTDGKQVFWIVTDEGRAYLEADDPMDRVRELIEKESQYASIYEKVLRFCDTETGRVTAELEAFVESDPLVQNPKMHFSHFAKNLEDCGALVWKKQWYTTESGRRSLELLLKRSQDAEEGIIQSTEEGEQ